MRSTGRPERGSTAASLFAPYAPVRALRTVVEFERERGLSEPVDNRAVRRAGVAPTTAARTLQALRFLALVDADGFRAPELDDVRRSPADDLPAVLAGVVRSAYRPLFERLDIATATDADLADAFRSYEPARQRPKMIALFRGLCAMAGIITDEAAGPTPHPEPRSTGRRDAHAMARPSSNTWPTGDPLLKALVEALPRTRSWTQVERDRWLAAWSAAVDVLVRIDG